MIFTSIILASSSGSLGGLVFSRNKGGPYIRAKGTPINPNTPAQQAVRSILSQLTSLWVDTVTAGQRVAWADYAANVPLLNPLGSARNVSAMNMYVRTNVPLLQAGFARQDDAPTIFDLGDYTAPAAQGFEASQVLSVAFTDTDDWVGEDDAALLIYASRQQNPTINFFKGPYQFLGSVEGDLALPPTSPQTFPVIFPITADNNVFVRAQVVRADGRLSADTKLTAPIVA